MWGIFKKRDREKIKIRNWKREGFKDNWGARKGKKYRWYPYWKGERVQGTSWKLNKRL